MADDPTFPVREPLNSGGLIRDPWRVWLRNLKITVDGQPVLTNTPLALVNQTASIGTTAFNTGTLSRGFYRFNYYATVTTAAGVSSGLIVTATWTDHGVVQTRSSANMTGNTTATNQSEVWPIHIDSGPVSYATTYASNPAGAMVYALYLVLETVTTLV